MSDVNGTVSTIVDTELIDAIKRNDIRDMLAAVNEIQSVLLRATTLNGRCPERFRLVNDIISSIESDCQDNPGQVSDETLRDYDDVFQSFMLR
jgi:hypothetical protein